MNCNNNTQLDFQEPLNLAGSHQSNIITFRPNSTTALRLLSFVPYPHQEEALQAHLEHLEKGIDKQLFHLATGTGKTRLFCLLSLHYEKSLFVVHNLDLLEQTVNAIKESIKDAEVGIIQGKNFDIDKPYTVAMVQTLRTKLDRIPSDIFDLVCIDECHHYASKTYKPVLEHLQGIRIGLTATPERHDGVGLVQIFDKVVYKFDIKDAIEVGVLCDFSAKRIYTDTSLDDVDTVAGDYNQRQLNYAINTEDRNQVVLDSYLRYGKDRKAIFFTVTVQHAKDLAALFREHSIRAVHTSGKDKDRFAKIKGLKEGLYDIIFNAQLLTEGFDCPDVALIGLVKPSKSRVQVIQMIGRGLRKAEGKENCLVLHYQDKTTKHSLIDSFDFFGKLEKAPEQKSKEKKEEETEEEITVSAFLEEQLGIEFNSTVALEIDMLRKVSVSASTETWSDGAWKNYPASAAQLELLEKHDFDITLNWTKGKACEVISSLPISRASAKLLAARGVDVFTKTITISEKDEFFHHVNENKMQPNRYSWIMVNQLERNGAFDVYK